MDKNTFSGNVFRYHSAVYGMLRSLWKIRRIIKGSPVISVNGHNHTLASDGKLGSLRLLFLNWLVGFKSVIVTDHNALRWDGREKLYAKYAPRILNIKFCPGIEFSCFFDLSGCGGEEKKEFHIVGMGIDPESAILREAIRGIQKGREEMTKRMLEKIREAGFAIIPFETLKMKSGGNVTLPDIAKHVRNKDGEKVEAQKFILEHLAAGKDCHVPNDTLLPVKNAIEVIKSCGGYAVWAHPKDTLGVLFERDFEKVALSLKALGIGGVEAFRDNQDAEDTKRIKSFCTGNGLEVRAGSDMHEAKDLLAYVRNMIRISEQDESL